MLVRKQEKLHKDLGSACSVIGRCLRLSGQCCLLILRPHWNAFPDLGAEKTVDFMPRTP